MVQSKKVDMSNGTTKFQSNMSFPRKDGGDVRGAGAGKNERQNGNAATFRTDSAISGNRAQGERTLQRWVPDAPPEVDGSLESGRMKSSGGGWDQFAENNRLFGLTTDYDESIYTTTIDKNHPQYKQRLAEAERKAREIERSTATNSHVAEERVMDNVGGDDKGGDEEDKYSGVRRNQDFPPLSSSNNKYTPPARRAPTGQSTVSGAPVDPAIISSQLARPDKPAVEKTKAPVAPTPAKKPEVATPPTTTTASFTATTPEPKSLVANTSTSASRTASPNVKADVVPNATATVERDVTNAFKNFAHQQRQNVKQVQSNRARNDKEIKLNDLKNFANSFKLNTPVPSDLVSIIAKDPAKQKEIQEKAKRNAEEANKGTSDAAKPIAPLADAKSAQRPVPASHGSSPSTAPRGQNSGRASGFQGPQFRGQPPQGPPPPQNRPQGSLSQRLRGLENKQHTQMGLNPIPVHETRQPPTGPANNVDPNLSRRSSGVTSLQAARLNPNSHEFRPGAAPFNPNGNQASTGSSPRSVVNAVAPTSISCSLLRRKPVPESDRPSLKGKFDALEHIKTHKLPVGKDWKASGGLKPAYDTPPTWKQAGPEEKPESTLRLTYPQVFEMAPYPAQTMSPPNPPHSFPHVPHQHQLPIHMQQSVHMGGARQSPRQPPMNMHGNQQQHGPPLPYNGHDDHRMMPSHSAQSYASPRLQQVPMAYPSPMHQNAQMYNPQMVQFPGGPPMQPQFRSLSNSHQFMPQQGQIGPIMMPNPAGTFLTSQGMAPGPQLMYPQGGPVPFMPPGNGHPPPMPVNGYPSPGRGGAPMMMNQGSQQGHQQQMYGMNPGMSPGPQFGSAAPIYAQQPPGQMPMRGYNNGQGQFGTSPQQMHQYPPQHRNNHTNGNYNNNKNYQGHGQHQNGSPNNQAPTGPQVRVPEGVEETK